MNRTLAFLLGGGGFLAGLLSANFLSLQGTLIVAGYASVIFLALLFWKSTGFKRLVVLLTFLFLGQLYFQLWEKVVVHGIPYGQPTTVEGSVASCREVFGKFRCIVDIT